MSASRGPRLLPPDPVGFHNRGADIDRFHGALADARENLTGVRCIVTGLPGIGKTWLTVRLAHLVGGQFPDAHFYYDLGGSAATAADPNDVLRHFLVRLGVDPKDVPADERERAAFFRSETADKRILMVLDDAASVTQVSKLLPSSPHSVVLVTSRKQLGGLRGRHGFHPIALDPLGQDSARHLLTRSLDLVGSETQRAALDDLIALCAGIPLSLRVAAARLNGRGRSLPIVVRKILSGRSLDLLADDDELSVEAIFDMSYLELSVEEARAYRLLPFHTGPEFGLPTAAALLNVDEMAAVDLLDALVEVNLLEKAGDDRFRFHAAVREHAQDRARSDSTQAERTEARLRVVRWYARRATALCKAHSPRWWSTTVFADVEPAVERGALAVAELELEQANLVEAFRVADELELDEVLPAFCEALQPWLYNSNRAELLVEINEIGLAAAIRSGDQPAVSRMHNQLGTGHELTGRFDLALEHFAISLEIARACDHVLCEQSALEWLGLAHSGKGDLELALRYLNLSLEVTERVHDSGQRERARMLITQHVNRLLDNHDRTTSVDELNRVLSYFHDNGEDINEARVLMQLASAHVASGQQRLAAPAQERAVTLFAQHNATALHARALRSLADTEDLLGEHEAAQAHRLEADRLTAP